jgi:ABC-type nitrate/sulfonate/bicarbonate transport system permease component
MAQTTTEPRAATPEQQPSGQPSLAPTAAPPADRQPSLVLALRRRKELVIDVIVILALWQASSYFLPPILAPSLADIGRELLKTITSAANLAHVGATVGRILLAMLISFLLGGALGVAMGFSDPARRYIQPLLHMIQGVPALSWVVFAVIWFREVELRILFVLVITTTPNFALHIEDAVRGIPRDLWELVRALRATRLQVVRMLIIPAITPEVMTAWKVNVGNATRVAVVAELVGATLGVGYQLLSAQQVFNMAGAIAWTVVLVIALAIIQAALTMLDAYLLRWRPAREVGQ